MVPAMRAQIDARDEDGRQVSLWDRDGELEVEVDGRVVVASDRQHANAALAELALGPWQGRDDISVLLGGLGSGLLLRELLGRPGVVRVDVVEASAAMIEWEARHFAERNGGATGDPRVRVHHGELAAFARAPRPDAPEDGWSALVVDTDEYPAWLQRPGNALFSGEGGLDVLEAPLRGGGVIALWTTEKDDGLYRRMHARLQQVGRIGAAGDQGLVYVHRGRRGARRTS